jgi:hypothetical protein
MKIYSFENYINQYYYLKHILQYQVVLKDIKLFQVSNLKKKFYRTSNLSDVNINFDDEYNYNESGYYIDEYGIYNYQEDIQSIHISQFF